MCPAGQDAERENESAEIHNEACAQRSNQNDRQEFIEHVDVLHRVMCSCLEKTENSPVMKRV